MKRVHPFFLVMLILQLTINVCSCQKNSCADMAVHVHEIQGDSYYESNQMDCKRYISTIGSDTMNVICEAKRLINQNEIHLQFIMESYNNKESFLRPSYSQLISILKVMLDTVHSTYNNSPLTVIDIPFVGLGETTISISKKWLDTPNHDNQMLVNDIKKTQFYSDINSILQEYQRFISDIGIEHVNYVSKDYFLKYNNPMYINTEIPDSVIQTYIIFKSTGLVDRD